MLDMMASIYLCYSFPKRLSSGLCHDHHHQAVFPILKQGKRKPKSSSKFLFMLDNMCVHHPVYLFTACIRFLCCLAVKRVCSLKICLKVVVHLRLKLIINSLFYYIEESYCLHSLCNLSATTYQCFVCESLPTSCLYKQLCHF